MEYNKNRFQKTNDKKVLHKVKKQWVVLSLSLLAAIGGGALASHVTTHADTTNNNNQTSTQTSTLKSRLNQSLIQSQSRQPSQSQAQAPQTSTKSITNQANVLHNRIVNNTVAQHLNQSQVKKNVNPNQGSVLQKRIDANAAQVGNAEGSTKFFDPNVRTNSDQSSSVAGLSAGTGASADSAGNGYYINSLSISDNVSSLPNSVDVTRVGSGAGYDMSNGTQSYANVEYNLNYQDANSNSESAYDYNTGSLSARVSDDKVAPSALSGSIGSIISGNDLVNDLGVSANAASGDFSISTSDAATITPTGLQWNNSAGKVIPNPTFTAKAKGGKAKSITVNIVNQSGQKVGSDILSGANSVGDTIDVASAVSASGKVPSNYSLAASQYNDYTFSDNAQNVTLTVNGSSDAGASVNLTTKYLNRSNSAISSSSASTLDALLASGDATDNNGGTKVHYGDVVTINPDATGFQSSGFVPSADSAYQFYVKNNGSLLAGSTNSASAASNYTYNYVENSDTATGSEANNAQTHVIFINQEGSYVTASGSTTSTATSYSTNFSAASYGQTLNLTDNTHGGVAVPSGYDLNYSLDDNDHMNYTFGKSNNSIKYVYLIGKQVTTNSTPNDTLSIKIGTKQSDNGSVSDKSDLKPNITGRVGSSTIITASDFLDNGVLSQSQYGSLTSKKDGLASSDSEYRVTFNPSGIAVTKLSKNNSNAVINGNDSGATGVSANDGAQFNYVNGAGSSTPSKVHTIHVNYLYQDQNYVDPSNNTPHPQWIQIPDTTVSDRNSSSSAPFSIINYEKNVPKGYQFVNVMNVNPNGKASDNNDQPGTMSNGEPVENNINATTNSTEVPTSFANDAVVNLEVMPTAGNITIQYYNQNGQRIDKNGKDIPNNAKGNSDQNVINGNSSTTNNVGAYSRYGQYLKINGDPAAKDKQSNSFGLWSIPKGYHLVENPNLNNNSSDGYQFTRDPQTIKFTVVGDYVNTNSNKNLISGLKINKEKKNGVKNGGSINSSTYVHNRIGNKGYVDPNDFAPAGYHATPSDQPLPYKLNNNGQVVNPDGTPLDPNKFPTWNYVPTMPSDENNFNINVKYIDQNGHSINGSGAKVNGYYGEHFSDITNYVPVPDGYQPDNSDVKSFTMGSGQASKSGDTVTLKVAGDTVNSKLPFTVYKIMTDANGHTTYSDVHTTVNDMKHNASGTEIGSSFTVNPSDYTPSGYDINSSDASTSVQVIHNPNGNGSALSTNLVVFRYHQDRTNQKAKPIVIHYMNEKTGKQVGTNDIVNGDYGKSVKISNGNIIANQNQTGQNNPDADFKVPYGYTVDSSDANKSVDFNSDVQNVYINLEGKQVSDTVIVHHTYRKADGSYASSSDDKVNLSGQVGDTVTISPYNNIKNGYHAANSDDDDTITLGANGHLFMNGSYIDSNNGTYGIGYVYNQNYNASKVKLHTITIHYITGNPNGGDHGTEIDTETDHGTASDGFNINPYKEDIPSFASGTNNGYYHFTGNVSSNVPDNFSKDGDVYIQVADNDGSKNDSNGTNGGPNNGNNNPTNQY